MRITMLGANHQTTPLEIREKLSLTGDSLANANRLLGQTYPMAECVILSTCNRSEVYTAHPTMQPPQVEDLRRFFSDFCKVPLDVLTGHTICRENDQAVTHLFRVASGLESMILGEPQILGQVKRSYETATQQKCVGPALHKIFQQAIATAKHVRQQTGIDEGRTSIASAAIDFAHQVFDRFSDKTVVSIGAGEIAKVTLRHLQTHHPKQIWLVNRTRERANQLLESLQLPKESCGTRHMEDLDALLVEADIVISSTGAIRPILTAARIKPLLKRRRFRPLFFLDIAVPRDIEQSVGSLRNVFLYNIDDLQQVVTRTYQHRAEHLRVAEQMIARDVRACMSHIQHRDVGQLIRQLRQKLTDLGQEELTRTQHKLHAANAAHLDPLLAEHTHRLINKILHMPLSQMGHEHSDAPLAFYATALRRLFQLEAPTPPSQDASPTNSKNPRTPPKKHPLPQKQDSQNIQDSPDSPESQAPEKSQVPPDSEMPPLKTTETTEPKAAATTAPKPTVPASPTHSAATETDKDLPQTPPSDPVSQL